MHRLPFELTDSAKLLHFTILGGSADPPFPPKWRPWVRPWSGTTTTCRASLAGRAWARQVQILHDDALMPGWHCSTVSGGALGTSLRDCIPSFGC